MRPGALIVKQYIGQAAYISEQPEAYSSPFYRTVPPGMLYPSLVFAILAAIVASQTMITATFQVIEEEDVVGNEHCKLIPSQLLSQIIRLSYFPQIKLKHTSKTFHGQIYIPWANWLLMIGTVIVTVAYKNVGSIAHSSFNSNLLSHFIRSST